MKYTATMYRTESTGEAANVPLPNIYSTATYGSNLFDFTFGGVTVQSLAGYFFRRGWAPVLLLQPIRAIYPRVRCTKLFAFDHTHPWPAYGKGFFEISFRAS